MYGSYNDIDVERRAEALWVRIGNQHGNEDLAAVFREANLDAEVCVVVLTGADEKVFCVGGGGSAAPTDEVGRNAYWFRQMRAARDVILSVLDCDKPIIGRINGHAIGRGCSLALCCDITIIAEEAKIGDTHVKVGLAAGDGGSLLWPNLVGLMASKRFLLTGDLLTGREAADIGLFTEVAPRAELDDRTAHWIAKLGQGSPPAVALTKRALNASLRQQAVAHMDLSLGLETLSYLTEDYREGVLALGQKRQPNFKGE
jgi:enoyl-CoA hydratase